jgi:uncharacterized membrane protein
MRKAWPTLALVLTSWLALYWQPRLYALLPVLIYGTLLITFGRTLLPGRQPLLAALAERFHGYLSPQALRYTRRITQLWTLLFAAAAVELSALALLAPRQSVVLWVNLLNLALVGALFLAEFWLRRLFVTDIEHACFRDYIAFLRHHGLRAVGSK